MEVPSGDRRLQGLECLQCVPPRTHCREDGLRGLAGRTVWGDAAAAAAAPGLCGVRHRGRLPGMRAGSLAD